MSIESVLDKITGSISANNVSLRVISDSPLGFFFTKNSLLFVFMSGTTIYEARIIISLTNKELLSLNDFTTEENWTDEGKVLVVTNGNALYFELEDMTMFVWSLIDN